MLAALDVKARGNSSAYFVDKNLRFINPFWRDLPHVETFQERNFLDVTMDRNRAQEHGESFLGRTGWSN